MTNEELRQKYRLLKVVAERDVRTYHALDSAGHIVMVHYLPGDSADSERLLALLDALIPTDQMRIVERVDVDGAPVVVTQFIQGFETLPVWLQAKAAQRPRAAAPPPSRAPGEFTQMFGAITSVPSPPPPEPTPAPEPPRPPAASTAAPVQGDFTGMFGPASGAPIATPPSSPSDAVTAKSPLARPPAEPASKKPTVRWREPSPESERPLVRWKQDASPGAPPVPPPAAAAPAPAAPPTAAKEPGDFTRLMAGISAPPSPPQAGSAGGSVGVTGAPGGPSDFTRIVAGLPAPPSQPPAQQPAEAAPQPRSSRLFVLLLALGLIGAAAAFLVLYFALKP